MLKYLVDTNVISEMLRPKPNPAILGNFERYQEEIATSAITWHELVFGAKRLDPSRKRSTLEEFLEQVLGPSVPILAYDERAAEWHAAERARLSKLGKTPSFADGQIAAIAFVNDLILVTLNTADYQNFQGIELSDWSQ
jgi:tRNA(fMet)-specific endonuclease VapC